jgi:protein TonB
LNPFIFLTSLFLLLLTPSLTAQPGAITASKTANVYDSLVTDEMPEFPGGYMGLKNYLAKNFIYPEIAKELGYEGKCYLKFTLDTAGYIKDLTVLKGVPHCPDCDLEAIRLVKAMPRWKPAKHNGKPVNVQFNLPIEFKMR